MFRNKIQVERGQIIGLHKPKKNSKEIADILYNPCLVSCHPRAKAKRFLCCNLSYIQTEEDLKINFRSDRTTFDDVQYTLQF